MPIMKKLSYTLFIMLFTFTNYLFGQTENQIFREGLYMATALGNDNFESIELYLKEKKFNYDNQLSENGDIAYTKFSKNAESATTILFQFGEKNHKVSFIFQGSEFAFLSRKLNAIIDRNQYMDPAENGYSIFFPNTNNQNKVEPSIGFFSFFYLGDNYISFETPFQKVDLIDWESVFLNLPDDYFQ